jgi:hypothetical protein
MEIEIGADVDKIAAISRSINHPAASGQGM